jgi:hypothetical protein
VNPSVIAGPDQHHAAVFARYDVPRSIAVVLWVAGAMIWDGITDHDIGVLKLL